MEFLAIGTAIMKLPGLTVQSQVLPPHAIVSDKDTWIDGTMGMILDEDN